MLCRVWIALSCLVWMSYAHPAGAEVIPGLPYERMESTDSDGNPLVYYITHPDRPAPLAVIIQDGGCAKLFEKDEHGRYVGDIEVSLYQVAKNRLTLLIVEKPFAVPKKQINAGMVTDSIGCPKAFLERNTFDNRIMQIRSAIEEARKLPWVDSDTTMVAGIGEGAHLASIVANRISSITDVVLIPPMGFPNAWYALGLRIPNELKNLDAIEEKISSAETVFKDINQHPDSITKWWRDDPYKYWSSMFKYDSADEMIKSQARTYVLYSYGDGYERLINAEMMVSRLQSLGKDITVRRIMGISDDESVKGPQVLNEYTLMVDWFLTGHGMPPLAKDQ